MSTNYSDRLPDELLVKIFRDVAREWKKRCNYWCQYENLGFEFCRPLNNLCMTCKRFNYIINNVLLEDDEEYVRLAIFILKEEYIQEAREELLQCKLKFRFLFLADCDLSRNDVPEFIENSLAHLDLVFELDLQCGKFDSVGLSKILTCLPRVEKLCITLTSSTRDKSNIWANGKIIYEDSPARVINFLNFCSVEKIECGLVDPLANIPARILDWQFEASRANLCLVRHYLLRHKEIIERFRFSIVGLRLKGDMWCKYFKGFSITATHYEAGCSGCERLEIKSSSWPPEDEIYSSDDDEWYW